MNVILEFEGSSIEVSDFVHSKKRADVGDPLNTTFIMRVKSAIGFAGESQLVCDIKDFRRFIHELDDVFNRKRESAKLVDLIFGSHITFNVSRRKLYTASGMLVGSDGENILKYRLELERSSLFEFAKSLREMTADILGNSAS